MWKYDQSVKKTYGKWQKGDIKFWRSKEAT